jgi:hypothetical protein
VNIIKEHQQNIINQQNIILNVTYPECFVIDPFFIGNEDCNDYSPYNSTECGLDEGDCIKKHQNIVLHATYPECFEIDPLLIGKEDCNDYSPYNSIECGLEGGDCIKDTPIQKTTTLDNPKDKKDIVNSTIIALAVSLTGGVLLIILFLLVRKRRVTKLSIARKAQVENRPVSSEEEKEEEKVWN